MIVDQIPEHRRDGEQQRQGHEEDGHGQAPNAPRQPRQMLDNLRIPIRPILWRFVLLGHGPPFPRRFLVIGLFPLDVLETGHAKLQTKYCFLRRNGRVEIALMEMNVRGL